MTKKDYIELVKVIKEHEDHLLYEHGPDGEAHVIHYDGFVRGLCLMLVSDNPRFDTTTFMQALKS